MTCIAYSGKQQINIHAYYLSTIHYAWRVNGSPWHIRNSSNNFSARTHTHTHTSPPPTSTPDPLPTSPAPPPPYPPRPPTPPPHTHPRPLTPPHPQLNKRLSKQSKHRWFETPSRPLWRHSTAKWKRRAWRLSPLFSFHSLYHSFRISIFSAMFYFQGSLY